MTQEEKQELTALRSAMIDATSHYKRYLHEMIVKYTRVEHYKLGYWECEDSPVGKCIYDKYEDSACDDCLYCHQPDERK